MRATTTHPTTATPSSQSARTTEFARLFDFFSRLASGDRDMFVPKEFESLVDVLPVSPTSSIFSLPALCRSPDSVATSISLPDYDSEPDRDHEPETTQNNLKPVEHPKATLASQAEMVPPRGRRTSIAVVRGRGLRVRQFPLADASDQQFTFKLMIHELYDINDFAAMVQEVLAASQKQFQPLPEAMKPTPRKQKQKAWRGLEEEYGDGDEEREKWGSGGKFPKGLGLGRPSGLNISIAERALKKRRVGRRRSVSGGPMQKEPEWIDAADVSIEAVPRINLPSPAFTARPRVRKVSSARTRTTSTVQRRGTTITPPTVVKEAPVVKFAESFLYVPSPKAHGRLRSAAKFERARSEEPDFGPTTPMSAPSTQDSFGVLDKGERVKTKSMKRRLSFSA
ncbi:hypothetical protein EUX98_g4665 [Antrodiella citrinella]|uniref:Uncharacterized protein n=1 Tax=Antrodiella citrinella TaxID=2447956 RepID=A0A4S4MTF8_9APHY|nr:hypothetical protein EUX98_g4665 [Antrodiella citrinella]